jgi:hypothetical protein
MTREGSFAGRTPANHKVFRAFFMVFQVSQTDSRRPFLGMELAAKHVTMLSGNLRKIMRCWKPIR